MIEPKKDREEIINLENVSLNIPVFSKHNSSLKRKILRSVTGGAISSEKNTKYIKALNKISLKIRSGEKIALIGHNGSGKSSFIRLLSDIYSPSKGTIVKSVNVYPMLQKSFIVEDFLTGIDAAKAHFLLVKNNLVGFSDFLEDVIEFSGLGEFISLPLRTYSEGMAARLMFSLLTYHTHECLAIDEGMGTGDKEFHSKAQVRLEEFIDKSGTMLLASHSEELIKKFCSRGLVFDHGHIVYDGLLDNALAFYARNN